MTAFRISLGCLLLTACSGGGSTSAPPNNNGPGGFGNGGQGGALAVGGNGQVIGNGGNGGVVSVGGNGQVIGNGGNGGVVPVGGASGALGGASGSGSGGIGAGGSVTGTDKGCDKTTLLTIPDDPSVRGPWSVGVRTVKVGRLTAEVLYPAAPGSEAGLPEVTYDIRKWLPPDLQSKVPDAESPQVKPIGGKLFRDVPIDGANGPYPVVIFMHGTSSFRIASGSTNVHWASRGFIVIAADYPGLMLADQLCTAGCACTASGSPDYANDIQAQITALKSPAGDLAFLGTRPDMSRIALSGHSVGGCTVATLSADSNVQVIIPLSSAAPTPATSPSTLKSTLYVSGMADTVFNYTGPGSLGDIVCPFSNNGAVTDAYTNSSGPPAVKKRLMGVTGGGHLLPTDLCQANAQGNNAIQVLHNHMICGVDSVAVFGLPRLFDCGATGFDWQAGVKDVNYATTAALEETLMCKDRSAAFANLKTALPTVGDFQEAK
ncbi:MAG TPA: hypothetical protein VF395_05295 [Polyangiaceae bacterium]